MQDPNVFHYFSPRGFARPVDQHIQHQKSLQLWAPVLGTLIRHNMLLTTLIRGTLHAWRPKICTEKHCCWVTKTIMTKSFLKIIQKEPFTLSFLQGIWLVCFGFFSVEWQFPKLVLSGHRQGNLKLWLQGIPLPPFKQFPLTYTVQNHVL